MTLPDQILIYMQNRKHDLDLQLNAIKSYSKAQAHRWEGRKHNIEYELIQVNRIINALKEQNNDNQPQTGE
jgi:hypothetical protein